MLTALVGSLVLSGSLLLGQTTTTVTAQPDIAPPPPAAEQPAQPPPSDAPKKKSAMEELDWKLYTKIGSGVLYAGWVALWIVAVPVTAAGFVLLGMSVTGGTALLAVGAVLVGVGVVAALLGVVAVAGAIGCAIPLTILQMLNPDDKLATESPATMIIPRTILL